MPLEAASCKVQLNRVILGIVAIRSIEKTATNHKIRILNSTQTLDYAPPRGRIRHRIPSKSRFTIYLRDLSHMAMQRPTE